MLVRVYDPKEDFPLGNHTPMHSVRMDSTLMMFFFSTRGSGVSAGSFLQLRSKLDSPGNLQPCSTNMVVFFLLWSMINSFVLRCSEEQEKLDSDFNIRTKHQNQQRDKGRTKPAAELKILQEKHSFHRVFKTKAKDFQFLFDSSSYFL